MIFKNLQVFQVWESKAHSFSVCSVFVSPLGICTHLCALGKLKKENQTPATPGSFVKMWIPRHQPDQAYQCDPVVA